MSATMKASIRTTIVLSLLWAMVIAAANAASANAAPPRVSIPLDSTKLDSKIPTLRSTLGFEWGQRFVTHSEMERYLRALVAAAPEQTRLVRYGQSYEQRALYYLVISSSKNMQRLDKLQAAYRQLSDPRKTSPDVAERLSADMPALVWLACNVHGNELSSTDAALATAYHLLADRRSATTKLLDQLVIILDPLQNPDGRQRFINNYREARGVFPSAAPLATERAERWPGGRYNHYLFDLNRDWFLQSQQETVAKVRAYLQWHPQIYIDAHEMGHNSNYFFTPPTEPANEFVTAKQKDWFMALGRNQAEWFDRYGFAYTTREMFDAFYPGYGTDWPTAQGAIGVLWEQAGVRGLLVERNDETTLRYFDSVLHHYVSAIATISLAAQRRQELLHDFYSIRAAAIALGTAPNAVQNFFLPVGERPSRTARLARILSSNGIDVYQTEVPLELKATDVRTGVVAQRVVSAGSYQIPVAQPEAHLIRLMLDRHADMGAEYIERQLQLKAKHLSSEIYDVTAWSLPLAFDVPCLAAGKATVAAHPVKTKRVAKPSLSVAKVAYLVPPSDGALRALSQWLQQGLRVHVTDKELTLGERQFDHGTLIVKVAENSARLHRTMQRAAREYDLEIIPAQTGFVTAGAHFGGPNVKWVKPPEVLLLTDTPASSTVGDTWYVCDQVLHYPTTRIAFRNASRVKLSDYNVVVLPDGRYSGPGELDEDFATRLKQWVKEGGTLVLIKSATVWATGEDIGLLACKRRRVSKQRSSDTGASVAASEEKETDSVSQGALPDSVPGAFLRAESFQEHWLTYACAPQFNVFFRSNVIFEPLDPEEGRNVVTFGPAENIVASGICWPKTEKLLPHAPYLVYRSLGSGHIIGFADDPNYRAMFPSLQRLFANAVMFGPGH